jgi:hypothetical protein
MVKYKERTFIWRDSSLSYTWETALGKTFYTKVASNRKGCFRIPQRGTLHLSMMESTDLMQKIWMHYPV